MLRINGRIKDFKFTSTEPLAIGLKIREMLPGSAESGLAAEATDWAWSGLVNNRVGSRFSVGEVDMEIVEVC